MSIRIRIRIATVASAVLSGALFSGQALGQAYPTKPVKVISSLAGGALDTMIRMISNGISGPLGQPVVVENRPSITFPQDSIAKGVPDGYTLGYLSNAVWLGPFLRENLPYDPIKDFSMISLTGLVPNLLAVNPKLPVNSVAELVAMAKAKPDELNIYMAGGGSPSLASLLFMSATKASGAHFTMVRYKGTPQGMNDVMGGRLHVIFPTVASSLALIKAGKIKGLAVTSLERSAQAPDLPTVASQGYPGFESVAAHAMLGPPGMPPAIVGRINSEVVKFLNQPDIKAKVNGLGIDVIASSPAFLAKFVQSEMDRMGPVFREAGIKPGDMSD